MNHKPLHTEFAALLRRSQTTQAQFARLCDVTARAVNNWCSGRQPAPKWAVVLALAICSTPRMLLEVHIRFSWNETLGVQPPYARARLSKARAHLAKRYHPDVGGDVAIMQKINAAYDEGVKYAEA